MQLFTSSTLSRDAHFPVFEFPVGKREISPISRSGKTGKSGKNCSTKKPIHFCKFSVSLISTRVAHFPGFQFPVGKREIWPISRSGKTGKSGKMLYLKSLKKIIFFFFSNFSLAKLLYQNERTIKYLMRSK